MATNVALATLLESDGASSWRAKANKVNANVDNVISTGTAENNGLIKIGSTVTGVGAVTSSYSFGVDLIYYDSGYSPTGSWTAGWLQNQDNLEEWGLYAKVGATTYGTISFQGQGTDWIRNTSTTSIVTRNVNVVTPLYNLEKASGGADLTGLSNQTFLDNAVNGIKDSSPTAFDTLGEIASAIPSSENVSAYINLNTATRVHTFEANGSDTEFSVPHTSGNVDVFVDGSLYVPQLSDSASGATSLLTDFDYFSNDGTSATVETVTIDGSQSTASTAGSTALAANVNHNEKTAYNFFGNGVPWVAFMQQDVTLSSFPVELNLDGTSDYGEWIGAQPNTGISIAGHGYRNQWSGGKWSTYTSPLIYYQEVLYAPQNGFIYQVVRESSNQATKIETSGTSCSKICFQFAPNAGQIITVKTY